MYLRDPRRREPYWSLNLYREAGEAGGCLRVPERGEPRGWPTDPERSAVEASRRARGQIRRYCAANRLNRLGTLTYRGAGCHDPGQLRDNVGGFFKALRQALGGEAFPYLWVPEWHPGGHGLHVHFAVGRYVRQTLIRDTWGRGHVHIKLLSNLPVGSGALEEARVSARYLSKYATKALDQDEMGGPRRPGLHRYEVAQGFQPQAINCVGQTFEDVVTQASQVMGAAPVQVWQSANEEQWRGPPACWIAWAA